MALDDTIQTIRKEYSILLEEKSEMMKRREGVVEIGQALEELRQAERRNDTDARKKWALRLAALVVMYLVDCAP